jgi:hypothetical protein
MRSIGHETRENSEPKKPAMPSWRKKPLKGVKLPATYHRVLKLKAAENETSICKLVMEMIRDHYPGAFIDSEPVDSKNLPSDRTASPAAD